VADFISRYGDSRFSCKASNEDEQKEAVVMQRAGWWLDTEDAGRVYLFISEGLRDATEGHDFMRVLAALDKAGWIYDRDKGDEGKRSKRATIGKRKERPYWILPGDVGE